MWDVIKLGGAVAGALWLALTGALSLPGVFHVVNISAIEGLVAT